LLRIFRRLPLWLVLAVGPLVSVPILQQFGVVSFTYQEAACVAGGGILGLVILRLLAIQAAPLAASISQTLAKARRLHDACFEKSETHYRQEFERIKAGFVTLTESFETNLRKAVAEAGEMRVARRMKSDERTVKIGAKNDAMHQARLMALGREHHHTAKQ
jgi:hypothetical protein